MADRFSRNLVDCSGLFRVTRVPREVRDVVSVSKFVLAASINMRHHPRISSLRCKGRSSEPRACTLGTDFRTGAPFPWLLFDFSFLSLSHVLITTASCSTFTAATEDENDLRVTITCVLSTLTASSFHVFYRSWMTLIDIKTTTRQPYALVLVVLPSFVYLHLLYSIPHHPAPPTSPLLYES